MAAWPASRHRAEAPCGGTGRAARGWGSPEPRRARPARGKRGGKFARAAAGAGAGGGTAPVADAVCAGCVCVNLPANTLHSSPSHPPQAAVPAAAQLPRGTARAPPAAAAQPPHSPAPRASCSRLNAISLPADTHTNAHTQLANRRCKASPPAQPRSRPALPGAGGAEPGPAAPLHPGWGSPRTPRASKYLPVHGRFSAIAAETVIHWLRLLRLSPSRCELEVSQSCPGHFRIISIFIYFSPLSSDRGERRGGWKTPSGIQPHPCRATSI